MKKRKPRDPNMPVGKLTIVPDFLPSPEELRKDFENVRITINLNKYCVDWFKKEAKRNHTKYQRMMREVLDIYASNYLRVKKD